MFEDVPTGAVPKLIFEMKIFEISPSVSFQTATNL